MTARKATMSMKASEVGTSPRQMAGKRDHREVLRDDDLVIRPGPNNFDWFMAGLAAAQPTPKIPEPNPPGDDKNDNRPQPIHRRIDTAAVGSLGCALTR